VICLCLNRKTLSENLSLVKSNAQAKMAELRIDLLNSSEFENIASFSALCSLPLILTCRKKEDGGQWPGDEKKRISLIKQCLDGSFSWLDLSENSLYPELLEKAESKGTKIIVSRHDFSGMSVNPDQFIQKWADKGFIPKLALMPGSVSDLKSLFVMAEKYKGTDKVILGMGPWGFASRILTGRTGSLWSYCSPVSDEVAPGQLTVKDMAEIYRYYETDNPVLFGIIGNPVLQTRSPRLHNRWFHDKNINALYVPFQVDDLSEFKKLADLLDLKGFSVTVPHKETIRSFLISEDEKVKACGSCNTVLSDNDGWRGTNTDIDGFIKPLEHCIKEKHLDKALVIGAGGASRAVVFALKQKGLSVLIVNRTLQKAQALAEDMDTAFAVLDEVSLPLISTYTELVIQTGSAGMVPLEHIDPFSFYSFKGTETVCDIIYKPEKTLLLIRAEEAGCEVLNGLPMLIAQGKKQSVLFIKEISHEN